MLNVRMLNIICAHRVSQTIMCCFALNFCSFSDLELLLASYQESV